MANRSVILELIVQDKNSAKVTKRLQKDFGAVEKSANSARSSFARSGGQLQQSFTSAQRPITGTTNAVSNLSRIVEDAPFGVRGVANNINPFITSFQRMQTEAGSTTGALKALISGAFTGPGAILTISALVTSAMTAMQMGLFSMGEEAEDTRDALEDLNNRLERTIELQAQFGAFDDDELGILEAQARIREITEQIEEQQQLQQRMVELERERSQIIAAAPAITEEMGERLEFIDLEIEKHGNSKDIQEDIVELTNQRQKISEELVDTADALADADTQSARAESDKVKAAVALIGLRAALLKLRREDTKELEKQRDIEREQQAALDRALADIGPMPEGGGRAPDQAAEGSIADIQMRIRAFSNMRQLLDPASEGFRILTDDINEARRALEELNDTAEGTADSFAEFLKTKAIKEVLFGLNNVLNKHQQINKALEEGRLTAKEAAEERKQANREAIRQIAQRILLEAVESAIKSIPFPLNLAAAAAAIVAGNALINSAVPSFRHGVDDFEGGMARVHQGEMLTFLPEGANVITNQNVERLTTMREESRQGAANLMGMRGGGIDPAMIERAIIEGMRHSSVNLSIDPVDEKLGDFSQLKKRVGNG